MWTAFLFLFAAAAVEAQAPTQKRPSPQPSIINSAAEKDDKPAAEEKPAKTDEENPDRKGKDDKKKADEKKDGDKDDKKKDDDKDDKKKDDEKKDEKPATTSLHAQGTIVSQGNFPFYSPYSGPNSFQSRTSYRTTETATIFAAARVWEGGVIVFNPEISGGVGLSSTLGMGGFPNGEATRVGVPEPTPYVARLFLQQTFGFGGEKEKVIDAANQIAGARDVDRFTVRIGKMSATDVIDDNQYSHDPRTQFLNWSLMFNGAWDYPANVRGYTYGAVFELNQAAWAVRYGVFAEPRSANGKELDPLFLQANGHILEWEGRFKLCDRAGRLRASAYLNHAHMGKYREALAETPDAPDVTTTRAYRIKYGFLLNLEQELADDLGLFARLGWNDGQSETWAFTEIDSTVTAGLMLKGTKWRRKNDRVGTALAINGLSGAHAEYLAAGGLGFLLGDGRLHYSPETIWESFYDCELKAGIHVAFDVQGVEDPGFNRQRGPLAIYALRVHFEY